MTKPIQRPKLKLPVKGKPSPRIKPVARASVKAKRTLPRRLPVAGGVREHHDVVHHSIRHGEHGAVHELLKKIKGRGAVVEIIPHAPRKLAKRAP